MRYRIIDLPYLIKTPLGRRVIREGIFQALYPIYRVLAFAYRRIIISNVRIIAVTGSLGKTTAARATAAALGLDAECLVSNNCTSFLADSLLKIKPRQKYSVLEVGISTFGQMKDYACLTRPDIAVMTSVASEHMRSLGSLEKTASEKAKIVEALPASGTAVLNGDDPLVWQMKKKTRARVVLFGFGQDNDIRAEDIVIDWPDGMNFTLKIFGNKRKMRVRLIGRHMLYPVLAAMAVVVALGEDIDRAIQKLSMLPPTPGRMQPVELKDGCFILRDDYKSAYESIQTALDVFRELPAKRKIAVLGDISEPPLSQGKAYGVIGEQLAGCVSRCIIVGTGFERYTVGAKRAGLSRDSFVKAGRSITQAAEQLKFMLEPGDLVLIKGRDTQRLGRIAMILQGRDVFCNIDFCDMRTVYCDACPMLACRQDKGSWRPPLNKKG